MAPGRARQHPVVGQDHVDPGGDDPLSRQQPEPDDLAESELRPRAHGAVPAGCRQLHRGRRRGVDARMDRAHRSVERRTDRLSLAQRLARRSPQDLPRSHDQHGQHDGGRSTRPWLRDDRCRARKRHRADHCRQRRQPRSTVQRRRRRVPLDEALERLRHRRGASRRRPHRDAHGAGVERLRRRPVGTSHAHPRGLLRRLREDTGSFGRPSSTSLRSCTRPG